MSKEQPAQSEPVAWRRWIPAEKEYGFTDDLNIVEGRPELNYEPLYATPPSMPTAQEREEVRELVKRLDDWRTEDTMRRAAAFLRKAYL